MCLALLTDKNLAPARACGGRYAWFCRATWMGEALAPNTKQGVLSHAGRAGPNSSRQGSRQSRQRCHTYGPRVAPEKRRWAGPHVADGCSGAAADRQTGLARDRGNTPTRTRQRKDQRSRHRARLIAVLPDSEATSAKEGARHLLGSPDADTP